LNFDNFIKTYQQRITKALTKILPNDQKNNLHQAMRYSVLNGGKRLRPILVYAVGLILKGSPGTLDTPACAVELIHCYSLIHDDLPAMDNSDLRRGKPSCHKAFEEATAILAGDALQALSFDILSRNNKYFSCEQQKQMMSTLSQACTKMAEGQMLDITHAKQISLTELTHINTLKTGALIEASIKLGIIAANCQNKKIANALSAYAQNIGLAFQIRDDILDVTESGKTLGKPAKLDQKLEKTTYPALIGLEPAQQKLQKLYQQAIASLEKISLDCSLLIDLTNYIIDRKY